MNAGATRAKLQGALRRRRDDRFLAGLVTALLCIIASAALWGEPRGGWRPVSDPPAPGERVVVDRGRRWCEGYADSLGTLRHWDTGMPVTDAARWMRVPE